LDGTAPAKRKKLVAIVDDSPLVTTRVRSALGRYGVEVKEFRRAEDLLAARRQVAGADLIILDRLLPGMDGLAALERIRETPELARTPIMMLTVSAEKAYVQRAAQFGVADYLLKPFTEDTLVDRVARIIGPLAPEGAPAGRPRPEILAEIRKEIKRAGRGKTALALLGVRLEEATPPERREEARRQMVSLLRETDTVLAAAGGDFVLLLPFADRSGTEVVRKKVGDALARVGVAGTVFAVASFPEDGEDEEALLGALERRLAEPASSAPAGETGAAGQRGDTGGGNGGEP